MNKVNSAEETSSINASKQESKRKDDETLEDKCDRMIRCRRKKNKESCHKPCHWQPERSEPPSEQECKEEVPECPPAPQCAPTSPPRCIPCPFKSGGQLGKRQPSQGRIPPRGQSPPRIQQQSMIQSGCQPCQNTLQEPKLQQNWSQAPGWQSPQNGQMRSISNTQPPGSPVNRGFQTPQGRNSTNLTHVPNVCSPTRMTNGACAFPAGQPSGNLPLPPDRIEDMCPCASSTRRESIPEASPYRSSSPRRSQIPQGPDGLSIPPQAPPNASFQSQCMNRTLEEQNQRRTVQPPPGFRGSYQPNATFSYQPQVAPTQQRQANRSMPTSFRYPGQDFGGCTPCQSRGDAQIQQGINQSVNQSYGPANRSGNQSVQEGSCLPCRSRGEQQPQGANQPVNQSSGQVERTYNSPGNSGWWDNSQRCESDFTTGIINLEQVNTDLLENFRDGGAQDDNVCNSCTDADNAWSEFPDECNQQDMNQQGNIDNSGLGQFPLCDTGNATDFSYGTIDVNNINWNQRDSQWLYVPEQQAQGNNDCSQQLPQQGSQEQPITNGANVGVCGTCDICGLLQEIAPLPDLDPDFTWSTNGTPNQTNNTWASSEPNISGMSDWMRNNPMPEYQSCASGENQYAYCGQNPYGAGNGGYDAQDPGAGFNSGMYPSSAALDWGQGLYQTQEQLQNQWQAQEQQDTSTSFAYQPQGQTTMTQMEPQNSPKNTNAPRRRQSQSSPCQTKLQENTSTPSTCRGEIRTYSQAANPPQPPQEPMLPCKTPRPQTNQTCSSCRVKL